MEVFSAYAWRGDVDKDATRLGRIVRPQELRYRSVPRDEIPGSVNRIPQRLQLDAVSLNNVDGRAIWRSVTARKSPLR